MDKRRKIVQFITAFLYNPHLGNLFKGGLYKGETKGVCVPGLNCYSCPAAAGSCPLGSLQQSLASVKKGVNTYVIGFLLMFAALFGRFVCGWLCPFGLLQELIYKIPVPKCLKRFKWLGWIKYAHLAILVLLIPILTAIQKGMGYPAFCKYICPQGTIGGLFLIRTSEALRDQVGLIFVIKILILAGILITSSFIFRPFCRFICPLGAIYGLFNKIALIRIRYNKGACTSCGLCQKNCPMKLNPVKECNHPDCIRCGKCIKACPEKALAFTAKKSSAGK
ncbi:MAG: 4Fe-4S binding protein [Lachnospiraceae bacterium]|nr:4Fe-4S binding protein [Lachnospiraceae bacterium]